MSAAYLPRSRVRDRVRVRVTVVAVGVRVTVTVSVRLSILLALARTATGDGDLPPAVELTEGRVWAGDPPPRRSRAPLAATIGAMAWGGKRDIIHEKCDMG